LGTKRGLIFLEFTTIIIIIIIIINKQKILGHFCGQKRVSILS